MNPYAVASLPWVETEYVNALCREFDSELFFADPTNKTWIDKAKMICDFCPHKDRCKNDARERGERYGVFGGEDAEQRRKFLRTGKESSSKYSPVRELANWGVEINEIAERLGIQHDSVTRNLRRKASSC